METVNPNKNKIETYFYVLFIYLLIIKLEE